MNYLAHLFFADADPHSIIGNLAADTFKGRVDESSPLAPGIRRHRSIDAFNDAHALVGVSRRRLEPLYRHVSRIIVDVFADHLLARSWSRWSAESFDDFVDRMYGVINANAHLFPEETRARFARMPVQDWLRAYAEPDGIRMALRGLSRRLARKSPLEDSVDILIANREHFAADFELYFADIVSFVRESSSSERG